MQDHAVYCDSISLSRESINGLGGWSALFLPSVPSLSFSMGEEKARTIWQNIASNHETHSNALHCKMCGYCWSICIALLRTSHYWTSIAFKTLQQYCATRTHFARLHPDALGKAAQTMQVPRQEQDVCPNFAVGLLLLFLFSAKDSVHIVKCRVKQKCKSDDSFWNSLWAGD